ncbi:MAG: hypothetical protein ACJAVO_002661 [Parvibaculaceae bacterium]|jgi:hypothetical protein
MFDVRAVEERILEATYFGLLGGTATSSMVPHYIIGTEGDAPSSAAK